MIPKWKKARGHAARPFFFFILIIVVLLFIGCAKQSPRNLLDGSYAGPMTASLETNSDSRGDLESVVVVSVPQSALVFKKQGNKIEAGLDVAVSAFSDNQLVGGGVATRKVFLVDWESEVPDSLLTVHVPLQISTAKNVVLLVRVRSLNSSRFWERQLPYHAIPWQRIPLALQAFNWNVGSNEFLVQKDDSLRVRLLVQENFPHPDSVPAVDQEQWWVVLEVAKPNGSFASFHEQCVPRGAAQDSLRLFFTISADDIPFGDVLITPLLLAQPMAIPGTSPWRYEHSLVNLHVNFDQAETWESHLKWLDGKSPETALVKLAEGTAECRSLRWDRFWSTNGPLLVESGKKHSRRDHLLLIVEAGKRFSHNGPGAESARGRALIRYGEPSEIQKVGDSTQRNEQWETWIYLPSQLKLIFQDPHGLGDFMLVDKENP